MKMYGLTSRSWDKQATWIANNLCRISHMLALGPTGHVHLSVARRANQALERAGAEGQHLRGSASRGSPLV